MLSTLNQFLSEKREASLRGHNKESTRYEIISRIYFLLDKLTEEQKLILLQQLLRDNTVDFIFKLLIRSKLFRHSIRNMLYPYA